MRDWKACSKPCSRTFQTSSQSNGLLWSLGIFGRSQRPSRRTSLQSDWDATRQHSAPIATIAQLCVTHRVAGGQMHQAEPIPKSHLPFCGGNAAGFLHLHFSVHRFNMGEGAGPRRDSAADCTCVRAMQGFIVSHIPAHRIGGGRGCGAEGRSRRLRSWASDAKGFIVYISHISHRMDGGRGRRTDGVHLAQRRRQVRCVQECHIVLHGRACDHVANSGLRNAFPFTISSSDRPALAPAPRCVHQKGDSVLHRSRMILVCVTVQVIRDHQASACRTCSGMLHGPADDMTQCYARYNVPSSLDAGISGASEECAIVRLAGKLQEYQGSFATKQPCSQTQRAPAASCCCCCP